MNPGNDRADSRRPAAWPGESPAPFLGIQWRLIGSFLLVGVAVALLVALALAMAIRAGAGWPGLAGVATAAAAVGTALAAIPGFVVARRLKHRLREVSRFAAALAAGNLAHRLDPDLPDEIGQLELQLNDMADRLADAMAALRDLADRNRALAHEAGALAERTRLARDLHDTVNQELFSLTLLAASARRRLPTAATDTLPDDALAPAPAAAQVLAGDLAEVETMARHAHATVRELILQLRPPNLAQQGLAAALGEYVRVFAARHGVHCEFAAAAARLTPEAEEGLLRMAQEALHNVAKHAGASHVHVELLSTPAAVCLSVRDDGRGFNMHAPVRPTAVGLLGLRERAAALGAHLRVHSAPGQGTHIEVRVPVTADAEREGAARAGADSGADC